MARFRFSKKQITELLADRFDRPHLQAFCRNAGLPSGGTKRELAERYSESDPGSAAERLGGEWVGRRKPQRSRRGRDKGGQRRAVHLTREDRLLRSKGEIVAALRLVRFPIAQAAALYVGEVMRYGNKAGSARAIAGIALREAMEFTSVHGAEWVVQRSRPEDVEQVILLGESMRRWLVQHQQRQQAIKTWAGRAALIAVGLAFGISA